MRALSLLALLLAGCAHETPRLRHHKTGAEATLEGLRGRVVLLNFWAEWCAPCLVEAPALLEETARHGGDVLLLAVHEGEEAEGRAQVNAWLASTPLGPALSRHVVWGNASLRQRYPARVIPTTYVLRRDGSTAAVLVGAVQTAQQQAQLRAAIESALGH